MASYTEFKPESTPVLFSSPWPRTNTLPGGKRYILWPVYAYKVLAPQPVERKLNLFQRAILGLCRTGQRESSSISKKLHLDHELVKFILSELRRSGYLNKDSLLTETGKVTLDTESDRLPDQIVTAYVFQDPWQSRLWPRIVQKLEFAELEFEGENPYPILILGSKGKPKRYRPFVKQADTDMIPRTPSPSEILYVSRYHERDKRLGIAAGNEDQLIEESGDVAENYLTSIENPVISQIETISNEPELFYITTTLYIPAYEQVIPDWYVWDPIGVCASSWLRRWIEQQASRDTNLNNYLNSFLVDCLGENVSISDDRKMLETLAREEILKQLGDLAELYPFYDWLFAMERTYQETKVSTGTAPQDKLQDVLIKAGKTLEGLFRHLQTLFPGGESWMIYNLPSRTNRKDLLDEIATSMGYHTPLPYNLSGLKPFEIKRSVEHGGGTLGERTVVTLLAAHRNSNHPLRSVAKEIPNLFVLLSDLMRIRGQSAHDTSLVMSLEDVEKQREIVYRIVYHFLAVISGSSGVLNA